MPAEPDCREENDRKKTEKLFSWGDGEEEAGR